MCLSYFTDINISEAQQYRMNKTLDVQELSIVIAARNYNPTILTPDFLKYSGIVPADWELVRTPNRTNGVFQVVFQNGISIVAQPDRIIFSEQIGAKDLQEVKVSGVTRKYIEILPNADYQAVGINLRNFVSFKDREEEDAAQNYVIKTLLSPGPWLEFGNTPVQAAIQFVYTLERGQCYLSVNSATLQLPEQETIPVVAFSANFNYNITENSQSERLQELSRFIDNWQFDLVTFREIVKRFLKQGVQVIDAPLIQPIIPIT